MPDSIPVAQLDPDSSWDPSVDVSATSALKSLKPSATEYAGVIYKGKDGRYARSNPTTQQERDGFALRAKVDKGNQLAAIWHVHPGDDDLGQVFSPHDIEVANQLKIPSYILFQKDGSIRRYVPGKTSTRTIQGQGHLQGNLQVADGEPIDLNDDLMRKLAVQKAYAATSDPSNSTPVN